MQGSDENPFTSRREKLTRDAEEIENRMSLERTTKLTDAEKRLIQDLDDFLSELPPTEINKTSTKKIRSEAFIELLSMENLNSLRSGWTFLSLDEMGFLRIHNSITGEVKKAKAISGQKMEFLDSETVTILGEYSISDFNFRTMILEDRLRESRFRYFNKNFALSHSWDVSVEPFRRAEIRMYCMEKKKYLRSLDIDVSGEHEDSKENWMGYCDVSPDEKYLATSWMNDMVRLIDTDHNSTISEVHEKTGQVLFSPSGRLLARCTLNGIHISTGRNFDSLQTIGDSYSGTIAFSPDEKYLACTFSQEINIHNLETKKTSMRFSGHSDEITSIAFSPDGEILVSGSCDKTVRLESIKHGKTLNVFDNHENRVICVAIFPEKCFHPEDVGVIYNKVASMMNEAGFKLETDDGIEFTISWEAKES